MAGVASGKIPGDVWIVKAIGMIEMISKEECIMNQKIQDLEAKLEATEKEREEYIRNYAFYAADSLDLWSEPTFEKVAEYSKKIYSILRQIKAEKSKKK